MNKTITTEVWLPVDLANLIAEYDAMRNVLYAIVEQQRTMGFDGSPSDNLMDEARRVLAVVGAPNVKLESAG